MWLRLRQWKRGRIRFIFLFHFCVCVSIKHLECDSYGNTGIETMFKNYQLFVKAIRLFN